MRKRWFLIAAVVLAVGLGYLIYSLFIHSGADYLTVSELISQGESLYDRQLRVEGKVVAGSINWDDELDIVRFTLTDDKDSLMIVYQGFVPENFKPGAELIVVGRYRIDGVLEASSFGSRRSFCSLCH